MKLREASLSAKEWPAEAKQALAGLAGEIVEYLDIKKNPEAKER